jgi:WD40 repeat protein
MKGNGCSALALALLIGFASEAAPQGPPDIKWMRGGHASYMTRLLRSADGSFFVSAGTDRTIKFWRATDWMLLRTYFMPDGPSAIALSPDDSILCAGGAASNNLPFIHCWNVDDGTQRWHVSVPGAVAGDRVSTLAFSPDGQRLASGDKLHIWNASDGAYVASFSGTLPNVFAGAFGYSPDGSVLAVNTAYDFPRLAFLHPITGSLLWDFGVGSISVAYDVAFSPDSQLVATVNGAGTRVFGTFDHVQRSFPPGSTRVDVAFSPNGARLAAGGGGGLSLWNTATGQLVRPEFIAHGNPGTWDTPVVFSADSTKLISGLLDIKRWKTSDGSFDALLSGQAAPVSLIALSADESVTATYAYNVSTDEHVISLFRAADGALLRYIDVGTEALGGLALSPDGKHLAAADNVQMRVWNVASGALERSRTESGRGSFYRPLAYTPDGTAIAEGGDDRFLNVMLWNPTTDTETFLVAGPATALRFLPSPDGRLVVARQIDYNAPPSVVNIVTLAGHIDRSLFGLSSVTAIAVSPDGESIVAGGVDGAYSPYYVSRIWRVSDGAALQTLVGHTDSVNGVGFAWDSQTVITGSRDATVRIWRASDGSQVHLYDTETHGSSTVGAPGVVSALASTRSGRFMYGRGDATVVTAGNPEAQPSILTFTVPATATGGCKPASAKVVLDRPAPPTGLTLTLASTLPGASVPATLAFKGGATSKSFKIATTAVGVLATSTISATLDGHTEERALAIRPIGIASLTLSPGTITGGGSAIGTVRLECQAVPGDIVVNLSSTMPSVTQPEVAAITIAHGTAERTFTIASFPVTSTRKPTIAAATLPDALSKSKKLVVIP